jgi:hypothetical protein
MIPACPPRRRPADLLALLAVVLVVTARGDSDEARRWREHLDYLASDAMRGRQTGSPEHLKAAEYVAAQFKSFGLKPAGPAGSYIQPVPFTWRRIQEKDCALDLVYPDSTVPLVLGEDATISMSNDVAPALEAPLVFAGYGISVPEQGYDDLAKVDVKGKLVVMIQGGPKA